ncbi:MAG: hypothetical protein A2W17_11600 [Planctomycetes bacterium RBG_16_41_13]|nr:MAG: hypothetical protein A2W17_11600 [Planctomycetes bacterium RBG_16_41_13]
MKNKVLLILLAVLMIGAVMYNIKKLSKKTIKRSPSVASGATAIQENTKLTGNTEFVTLYLKRKDSANGWERNPFYLPDEEILRQAPKKEISLQQQQQPPPDLKLELVLTADNQRVAILSGQFVKEGDRIGDEVVVKIESDMVILKKNVSQRVVKLDSFYNSFQIGKRKQ